MPDSDLPEGSLGVTPPRPKLAGWRKALVVLGGVAVVLRLLLALIAHTGSSHTALHDEAPAWPVKADDVLRIKPGDSNVARWGRGADADPFQVSKVVPGGEPAVPNTTLCLFAPEYVADAAQPGGTLTVLGHDLLVGWRVHWCGGDTVLPSLKTRDFDPNCGREADLLLTATQLHDLLNIVAGLPRPPPEPDGVPAGTEITLPPQR